MNSKWRFFVVLLLFAWNLTAQEPAPVANLSNCEGVHLPKNSRSNGGRLKHKVAPKYPEAARDAHLSGIVRLSAMIGKDGQVKDVKILQGDFVLADAAAKAVGEWRYAPFRIGKEAIEVPVIVAVTFEADGRVGLSQQVTQADPSNATPSSSPISDARYGGLVYRIGGDVVPPRALDTPDPGYSENARRAKKQGMVLLAAVVDSEGRVREADVCKSLDPELDQKAVETVRQWKFQPATKNSQPVAVLVSVQINFRLY